MVVKIWSSFKDPTFGYSINYPPFLAVDVDSLPITSQRLQVVAFGPPDQEISGSGLTLTLLAETIDSFLIDREPALVEDQRSTLIINGEQWLVIETRDQDTGERYLDALMESSGRLFQLSSRLTGQDIRGTFFQMLSTLRVVP